MPRATQIYIYISSLSTAQNDDLGVQPTLELHALIYVSCRGKTCTSYVVISVALHVKQSVHEIALRI